MFCTMPIVLQPAFFLSEGKVLLTGKSSLLNLYKKNWSGPKSNHDLTKCTADPPRWTRDQRRAAPAVAFFLFVHAIGAISNAKSSVGILQSAQFLMVGWALCSCRATKLPAAQLAAANSQNQQCTSKQSIPKSRSQFDAKPNYFCLPTKRVNFKNYKQAIYSI